MTETAAPVAGSTVISKPAESIPDHKKRKINGSRPGLAPRTIAPFKQGQSETKLLFPLSNYAFRPRLVKGFRDHETKEDEAEKQGIQEKGIYKRKPYKNPLMPMNNLYFKELKSYNEKYGTRRYLQFLIVAGGDNEPIVMLFKDKIQFVIPGGYLNHDEDETEGGERLLKELFDEESGSTEDVDQVPLKIGEVVGRWWRTELKQNVYPYLPRHVTKPKELIKTVLVNIPKRREFAFPEIYKSFYPYVLVDLYDQTEPELKAIPLFLSKFSFSYTNDKGSVSKEITDEPYTPNN